MSEDIISFALLAVVVVVVTVGFFLCEFLLKCKHNQAKRRHDQPEPVVTSRDKHGEVKDPRESADTEKFIYVINLPPSYDQCMASQNCFVDMERPPTTRNAFLVIATEDSEQALNKK